MKVLKTKSSYYIKTENRTIPLSTIDSRAEKSVETDIKLILYRDLTENGREFLSKYSRRNYNPMDIVGVINGTTI
jgi:hypothetical protein